MGKTCFLFLIKHVITRDRFGDFLKNRDLRSFATNATGKLHVFGHDGDALSMECTQICVFKEAN